MCWKILPKNHVDRLGMGFFRGDQVIKAIHSWSQHLDKSLNEILSATFWSAGGSPQQMLGMYHHNTLNFTVSKPQSN